jgi:hypothetical protein
VLERDVFADGIDPDEMMATRPVRVMLGGEWVAGG